MLIIAFRLLFIRQDDRHDHFCNLTTGRVIAPAMAARQVLGARPPLSSRQTLFDHWSNTV